MGRKRFDPVSAARSTAQYMPADPVVWLDRAALAGMQIWTEDGRLVTMWDKADPNEATFLSCWLSLTPGGKSAVVKLLQLRDPSAV